MRRRTKHLTAGVAPPPPGQSPYGPAGRTTRAAMRVAVLGAGAVLGLLGCATPAEEPEAPREAVAPVDPGWPMREVDTGLDVELAEPFVRLVDLSRLRIGMTKAEVLALFPDPYEIRLRQGDEFWQYGFAELIFRDGRLRDWFDL